MKMAEQRQAIDCGKHKFGLELKNDPIPLQTSSHIIRWYKGKQSYGKYSKIGLVSRINNNG